MEVDRVVVASTDDSSVPIMVDEAIHVIVASYVDEAVRMCVLEAMYSANEGTMCCATVERAMYHSVPIAATKTTNQKIVRDAFMC